MATLCNAYNDYDSSGTSINTNNGGRIVDPAKKNVKYLRCPLYDNNLSDNFPDTLTYNLSHPNSDPYSQCTKNQRGNCKDINSNTGNNVERWTVIQSSCSGHTKGRNGTSISIGTDIIDYTDFQDLYNAVSAECSARGIKFLHNQPSTYQGKIVDDQNPFEALNAYLEKCKDAKSGTKHTNNNQLIPINPEEGAIIKHSDVSAITTNLNNITQDCICYSDCNGYSVCYCYGNCQYY